MTADRASWRFCAQAIAGTVLLAWAGMAAAAADVDGALRHDPFRRPHLGPGPAPSRNAGGSTEAAAPAPAPAPWQPELRGVMLAGDRSLANVEGRIVRIGEAIDGWRLVRVEDGLAVFARAGAQTTLTMNQAGQPRR